MAINTLSDPYPCIADFGLEKLAELVAGTSFPWLMSNVVDRETGRPLADGLESVVLDWAGHKVGLVGLVESEWLDTLATINTDQVLYTDYVTAAARLARELRQQGCSLVIALTHMRTPNDIRLAESEAEIGTVQISRQAIPRNLEMSMRL